MILCYQDSSEPGSRTRHRLPSVPLALCIPCQIVRGPVRRTAIERETPHPPDWLRVRDFFFCRHVVMYVLSICLLLTSSNTWKTDRRCLKGARALLTEGLGHC